MLKQIKYQAIWGKLYILFGFLFGLLFIFSGIMLGDYSIFINVIASIILIYFGFSMKKYPYAKYGNEEIIIIGRFGTVRKHYLFKNKSKINVRNNKLYLEEKKLRVNPWMINKKDWRRMMEFYDPERVMLDELKD